MIALHLRKTWARWGLGLLVLSGCFYSFDNPVEQESPGSIGGGVQLVDAVGGQTLQGGHVTVPWTNGLDLTLDSTGKFLFADLPDGTYSLSVNIPPLAVNDYSLLLLRPGVIVPDVAGTVDSLDIGTLQVPASGLVGGTVSPPTAGIVVGAFAPTTGNIDAGLLGTYEGFYTVTDSSGHYQIQLPAGQHVVAASNPGNNAVGAASVQPAATQTLDLTLQQTQITSLIYGELVGTGFGVSSTANPFPSLVTYAATANGVLVADGGLTDARQSAGLGTDFQVGVPGGSLVTLELLPPPSASPNPCDTFAPFTLAPVPVIAGCSTPLGQVTWLSNAALGANDIGPCAPKDGGTGSGTTTGTIGGTGTTSGGGNGTGGGTAWLDSGTIPWDGGEIVQTAVFPFTPDGGRLLAWLAGTAGQSNLFYASNLNGYTPAALTIGGNVAPGTLSGTELNDGVLLSFATFGSTNTTACEFISATTGPAGAVQPNFPSNPLSGLGYEETTTFTGKLNGVAGAFVLQPEIIDAGIIGSFSFDGQSFPNTFPLSPTTTATIIPLTLIATSCDVSDLSGEDGFCLAGSGELVDPDAGPQIVAFISSVETSGSNPVVVNTQILSNTLTPPIYVGLASLPGQIAVTAGTFGGAVTYWQLSSLASTPGLGISAPLETDLLINWDNHILGLSWAGFAGTAGIFLPDGGQSASIPGLASGSDILTGYYEPATDSIITAGILHDEADNTDITVWRLPNAGSD